MLVAAVVLAGAWSDRAARATGPEAALADYASAVRQHDLEGALSQIAPESRPASAQFVQWQLGNSYIVLESAVRGPSIIEARGGAKQETTVVVTVDIQEESGGRWRTTEELPVTQSGGRWYLARPLLLPSLGEPGYGPSGSSSPPDSERTSTSRDLPFSAGATIPSSSSSSISRAARL